jgi:predicted ATP-grasp superfamily ATP-dependent carboligase
MNPAIVVTHGGGVNGLGIVRSLGRLGIKIYVVTLRGSNNLATHSHYCSKVYWLEEETTESLSVALKEIANAVELKPILFCDSDESLYLAATCPQSIRDQFIVPYPLDRFQELQNKEYQTMTATAAGIDVPQSWYINNWDDFNSIKVGAGHRLIVKPNPSIFVKSAPFKIFWADNIQDAIDRLKKFVSTPQGMIVQEWIEGSDENMWVVSGYRSINSKTVTMLTVVKTKQSGSGAGGIGVIVRTKDSQKLKAINLSLLEKMDYFGPFATEYKYCEAEEKFYFIESNNRTAKIHMIGRRKGADLPAIIYSDLTNSPELLAQLKKLPDVMWYYDMAGCIGTLPKTSDLRVACNMIRHMLMAPFRKTEWAVHAWDDSTPFTVAFRIMIKDLTAKIGRKLNKLFGTTGKVE